MILQQNRSALELIMHYVRRVKVRTFSYGKEHGGTFFLRDFRLQSKYMFLCVDVVLCPWYIYRNTVQMWIKEGL